MEPQRLIVQTECSERQLLLRSTEDSRWSSSHPPAGELRPAGCYFQPASPRDITEYWVANTTGGSLATSPTRSAPMRSWSRSSPPARRAQARGQDEALQDWRSAAACTRGSFRPDGYGCYRTRNEAVRVLPGVRPWHGEARRVRRETRHLLPLMRLWQRRARVRRLSHPSGRDHQRTGRSKVRRSGIPVRATAWRHAAIGVTDDDRSHPQPSG